MNTPSFKEDHISQIPALQLLLNLGYHYLSPDEALNARGNKTSQVILDSILRTQLAKINSIQLSATKTAAFSESNIEAGIRALKEIPLVDGFVAASEKVLELLTLGKALEQNIDGDKKSFNLHYIDWKNPQNNVFHVTEEFSVMRAGSKDHFRPDLVLFVNGIPLAVIECKRPDIKDSMRQAISQHLRNQQSDGIPHLYLYTQTVLALSSNEGRYAASGTQEKFWAHWEEKFRNKEEETAYFKHLQKLKNTQLPNSIKSELFGERYAYVRTYFDALEKETILPTAQDQYLYGLCRPERLLDFAHNFILFDAGTKKIARYQQYFAIKKTMDQIRKVEGGKRKGGVIWHTQGSGKSLTMVLLAQAIAMDPTILNPKIVLVTDRTDLDRQITSTFKKCKYPVLNAATGARLVELLKSKSDAVITTIINKFETAVKKIDPLDNPNIFVLVDEGHRTQHGSFNIEMQKTLPNACFIALTGTPLFKKDKNTLRKFGTLIDQYTVDKAVADKAVVPLLYEGRHAYQNVNEGPIDNFFTMVSEPLPEYGKADLKKKFSRKDQLNIADQKIYAICWDISKHYKENFKGLGFKGQLVCQSKEAAIRYKKYLDEINIVSSDVVISPPDDREGEESAYGTTSDLVKSFWKKMMDEHGNYDRYQKNIISRFEKSEDPEIIIVVDKLLTGFDVPINTVLYLTRRLQGHTLLQAIARVNRICEGKDYGYIVDYYGVLGSLEEALETYSSFDEFDPEDLMGTFTDITTEIALLPQKHADLLDLFKEIKNKRDAEAYQVLLRDEAIRQEFYNRLSVYARILKLALSSIEFHQKTDDKKLEQYKEDLASFVKIRNAVIQRYSDAIDYKQYEGQIQKLIDTHVTTEKVVPITDLVNIFDKEAFQDEVEKTIGTVAKADKIASRTSKHISEKMDEDPAFYKKFSELLKETIREYEEGRISDLEYLEKVKELQEKVLSRTDSDIPSELVDRSEARAFYGIALQGLENKSKSLQEMKDWAVEIALFSEETIKNLIEVDWTNKIDITKKMLLRIGDFLIDEIRDKYQISLSFEEIDHIAEQIIENAKLRFK